MCKCDELRQLLAAACKERDELKRLLDQARGERDAVTKRMIQLEQEHAALVAIVKNWGECEHCKHNGTPYPGEDGCIFGDACARCQLPKIPCCTCRGGSQWVWRGLEALNG